MTMRQRVVAATISLVVAISLSRGNFLFSISFETPREVAARKERRNDTIHHESLAILPLLPWEEEAIRNLRNGSMHCDNPAGVPDSCCPGSFSRGGGIETSIRHECDHADYELVEELAMQFFHSWPAQDDSCDVCRILDVLKTTNLPLTVLGDSLTMQAFDGLICELARRSYIVEKKYIEREQSDRGWGNIKGNTFLYIRSPSWRQDEVVTMQFFFVYSVPLVEIPGQAEEFNNAGGVLWFNVGLHDHEMTQLKSFFATIKANATFSLVLFRETTAQHFDLPGGMYSYDDHNSNNCTPLEWTKEVGYRDRVVRDAALEAGYEVSSPTNASLGKLVMLSYHNFTVPLHNIHPTNHGAFNNDTYGECTHYCSTPFLWMPLWRTIRISMDTAFS